MSSDKAADAHVAEGIPWRDDEEEGQALRRSRSRTGLHRSNSNDSLIIRSIHGRTSIDPGGMLPIQYRTISFQIEESKGDERAELAIASEVTAQDLSDLEWHMIASREVTSRLVTWSTIGLSEPQLPSKETPAGVWHECAVTAQDEPGPDHLWTLLQGIWRNPVDK
ncbi:hypothetical protein E4U58_004657 [Claviceps cyperi]|nr:hypothetical protein E4U58_004657 [Claviceps cyperi]